MKCIDRPELKVAATRAIELRTKCAIPGNLSGQHLPGSLLCYTRRMLFLIPHLFPSARLLEAATQDLRLPALQTLLARGTRQSSPAEGMEAVLCEALGIARQQDWPVAPISLEADGGVAGEAYWLRADPVHLRVMRDRIVLADSDTLELTQPEADALTAAIDQHFGAGLSPIACHPKRWYLRLDAAPRLTTHARSVAVGCDIDPLLPHGDDAMQFRAWLNEVQMLLHDHPVNLAREARGALPINALWLWGGRVPAGGAHLDHPAVCPERRCTCTWRVLRHARTAASRADGHLPARNGRSDAIGRFDARGTVRRCLWLA